MPHALRRGLAAVVLFIVAACGGDPSGPEPPDPPDTDTELPSQRVTFGDTVGLVLEPGTTAGSVTIQPAEAGELAFFVQAVEGTTHYQLTDSVSGTALADAHVPNDPAADNLYLRRTAIVPAAAGQVIRLRLLRNGTATVRVRVVAYEVHRAPEGRAAAIASPDTVSESLENGADLDEYAFTAAAGDEYMAFLQPLEGTSAGTFQLVIQDAGGNTVKTVARQPATELESATQRFTMPAAGAYRATVRVFEDVSPHALPLAHGAYRFQLRRVDRGPESVPATLAAGDTLDGEAIDYIGDIDEFLVPAQSGDYYNVFLQAQGAPAAVLQATALSGSVTSDGEDATLVGQFTGRILPQAEGEPIRVTVSGLYDDFGMHRGPYRLFVYHADPLPETAPVQLVPGVLVEEAIEFPGDWDTYQVQATPTGMAMLTLERVTPGPTLDARMSVIGQPDGVTMGCAASTCDSRRFISLGATSLAIESASSVTTSFQGTYRLLVTPIDTTPEGRGAAIALGETVTEAVDPSADLDVYTFTYNAGQILTLALTGDGASTIDARIVPTGSSFPISLIAFTLPATGQYSVKVDGVVPNAAPATGAYTFTLAPVATVAEGGGATIMPGDSLTSEAIETYGDVDEIMLQAPAGTEVQAYLRGPSFDYTIEALEPGAYAPVRPAGHATGRVIMPAGGQLRLRVREPFPTGGFYTRTGEYDVVVHAIDRAPEVASPVLAFGVTVDGEKVDFAGDVDEYTFAGTAGQQVAASILAPQALSDVTRLVVEVIDPSNGTVLGSADAHDSTVGSTGQIVLPGTREYMVRVRGESDVIGYGAYRITVVTP